MYFRALLFLSILTFPLLAVSQEKEDLLSRKVSLNMRDTSIEEILKAIETDDFAFTYSAEIFDVKKRTSINVKDETIGAVLEILFRGQGMECQQMGNKLLIRKKRVPQKSVPKLDTIKEKKASEASNTPPIQKTVSEDRSKRTKVEEKREELDSSTVNTNLASADGSSALKDSEIDAFDNEQYYIEQRRGTAKLVAAYESMEKKSLIFVPIYPPKLKNLAPFPIHINIAPEEAPKEEEKPKAKKEEQPSDKKFRINLAPNVGYSEIGKRDAILIGGHLAYNPTKNFGIGVAGKGFITRNEPDVQLGADYSYSGGYGGLLLEATLFPNQPFHLSFPVIFGLGEIMYNSLQPVTGLNTIEDRKPIFVFEPGAYLEMNVIKYMRIGFGATYRDASSANLKYQATEQPIMAKNGLDGLSISVMIKFGLF